MLGEQDQMVEEIHALRSDLKNELIERFTMIEHEPTIMKETLHKSGIMV